MKSWINSALLVLASGVHITTSVYSTSAYADGSVELLHWWTAKGERRAFSHVETQFSHLPLQLKSEAIAGGGGAPAKSILQARAIAGNPPDIAQIEGPAIQSWAMLGFLHPLDEVARVYQWDQYLFPEIQAIHQYNGHYVAVPINIHRLNWMWMNLDILSAHDITPPKDWDALMAALTLLKDNDITPLALGREPWQVVQIFENIAFGVGGAQYYHRAFVELDGNALNSDNTLEALKRFRDISQIVGKPLPTMSWDEATQAMLDGQYAFQFTGDWALGEMLSAETSASHANRMPAHIGCAPFPSTESGFIYNADSFAFFNTATSDSDDVFTMAATLASPDFMLAFNQDKGSIPVRSNIDVSSLSRCQQQSFDDFIAASARKTTMPSLIDSMAVSPVIQNAVSSELYQYFNDPTMSAETLLQHLNAIHLATQR
uniref:ABC transporter substrate-binding protein n=1 Tax=Thaumasiovibrio occultus TaxID=1891184 RepID=UPI000B3597C7|nr:ABC transporter substrate-binding protein [Thaumasiovibrio occultus]